MISHIYLPHLCLTTSHSLSTVIYYRPRLAAWNHAPSICRRGNCQVRNLLVGWVLANLVLLQAWKMVLLHMNCTPWLWQRGWCIWTCRDCRPQLSQKVCISLCLCFNNSAIIVTYVRVSSSILFQPSATTFAICWNEARPWLFLWLRLTLRLFPYFYQKK